MRLLSIAVAALSLVSLFVWWDTEALSAALLGAFGLICAVTTFRSRDISTFLKIFVAIFSSEVVIFGAVYLFSLSDYWPKGLDPYKLPDSVPLTVAIFSILVWAVSHFPVVRAIACISDRYFETSDTGVARIWPFPTFRASERSVAIAMVVTLVVINQAQVGMSVRLSYFNRDWFNAIQSMNQPLFWSLLYTVFLFWVVIYIASLVLEYVLQSILAIRWRRWLTNYYVSGWLDGPTHYRMSLRGGAADNPDQRIAEDVNRFIDGGGIGYGVYSYSILLISTLSSLVSFAIILWTLSADFTIPGTNLAVPGFLFWVALIYTAVGTLITHFIGRSLVGLSFERQRYEADFRFSLARLREYSEQVALLKGEPAEQRVSMGRFGKIYANYLRIVDRKKKLTAFTNTYGQISPFIPYIVAAPFYFAGKIQLGVMSQTAGAFGRVQEALNFFVNYYTQIADFKAVLNRLTSFDESINQAHQMEQGKRIALSPASNDAMTVSHLNIALPDGRVIIRDADLDLPAGQATLVAGPSGSGKSTLFRAISGLWPYGDGDIRIPKGARVMLLPQKPYIPIGSLRAAVAYPSDADAFDDATMRAAIEAARLSVLLDRLDTEDNWSMRLSGGEQQRLAIARALLAKPDWLLLDEATASLDDASEAAIYKVLAERLPQTTIVSIGHRSTLMAFHQKRIEMQPVADGVVTPRELPAQAVAE